MNSVLSSVTNSPYFATLQAGWNNPNVVLMRRALTSSLQSNWDNPNASAARRALTTTVQTGWNHPTAVSVRNALGSVWNHPTAVSARATLASKTELVWNHPSAISTRAALASRAGSVWNHPSAVSARTSLMSGVTASVERLKSLPLGTTIGVVALLGGLFAQYKKDNWLSGVSPDDLATIEANIAPEEMPKFKQLVREAIPNSWFFKADRGINIVGLIPAFKTLKYNPKQYDHVIGAQKYMARFDSFEQRQIVESIEGIAVEHREPFIAKLASAVEQIRLVDPTISGGMSFVSNMPLDKPEEWDSHFSMLVKTYCDQKRLTFLPRSWGVDEDELDLFTQQFPVEGQRSIINWLDKKISTNEERRSLLERAIHTVTVINKARPVTSSQIIGDFENHLALKVPATSVSSVPTSSEGNLESVELKQDPSAAAAASPASSSDDLPFCP